MTVVDARRLTALGAGLLTLVAVVGPAAGESPSTDAARNLVSSLLRVESPAPPPAGVRPDDLIPSTAESSAAPILTTSVVDREPTDLRLLLAPGERWHLMEVGATAT